MEDFDIKEETVSIKEEILPVSTVEDTCTVYVQGEIIKRKNEDNQSKNQNYLSVVKYYLF